MSSIDRDALKIRVRQWWDRNGVDADPGAENIAVQAILPTVTQAIRAAEQRGREQAAQAIEAAPWFRKHICGEKAARLARGGSTDEEQTP